MIIEVMPDAPRPAPSPRASSRTRALDRDAGLTIEAAIRAWHSTAVDGVLFDALCRAMRTKADPGDQTACGVVGAGKPHPTSLDHSR